MFSVLTLAVFFSDASPDFAVDARPLDYSALAFSIVRTPSPVASYSLLCQAVERELLMRLSVSYYAKPSLEDMESNLSYVLYLDSQRGILAAVDLTSHQYVTVLLRDVAGTGNRPFVAGSVRGIVVDSPAERALARTSKKHIPALVDECLKRIDDERPIVNHIARLASVEGIRARALSEVIGRGERKLISIDEHARRMRLSWFTRHHSCEATVSALAEDDTLKASFFRESVAKHDRLVDSDVAKHKAKLLIHMIYSCDSRAALLHYHCRYPPSAFSDYAKKHAKASGRFDSIQSK